MLAGSALDPTSLYQLTAHYVANLLVTSIPRLVTGTFMTSSAMKAPAISSIRCHYMECRSQLGLTFKSTAKICEERSPAVGVEGLSRLPQLTPFRILANN